VPAEDEKQFLTAVKNCWRVFGENAFRKPTTGNRSAPMADAYMVALSTVDPKDLADDKAALKVGTALNELVFKDEDFQKANRDRHQRQRRDRNPDQEGEGCCASRTRILTGPRCRTL
jgi:hypothetical protein